MTPENIRYNAYKQKKALEKFGLPGEGLVEMIQRESKGLNLAETAEKFGISLVGLNKWRKSAGIEKRSQGEYVRRAKSPESLYKAEVRRQARAERKLKEMMGENALGKIEEMLMDGQSVKKIAQDTRVSLSSLANCLEILHLDKKTVIQKQYHKFLEADLVFSLKPKSQRMLYMYCELEMTANEIALALSSEGEVISHQGVSDNIRRSIRSLNKILMGQAEK